MKLRFSLRTLMICVTLFCVALGLGVYASRHAAIDFSWQPEIQTPQVHYMPNKYLALTWDGFIIVKYISPGTFISNDQHWVFWEPEWMPNPPPTPIAGTPTKTVTGSGITITLVPSTPLPTPE